MADEDLIAWEMLYGGGDAPSEEWQPPADWLEVPEPGEWEANFLIEIRNIPTFCIRLFTLRQVMEDTET